MNILHLSHSDINHDGRILKEIISIANYFDKSQVIGIGMLRNNEKISNESANVRIHSLDIKSKKWKIIKPSIRHFFILLEFYAKILFLSIKIKPQIIHCHEVLVLPISVILKFFTSAKLIYDAHELESATIGLSRCKAKMTLFIENFSWRFIDNLIIVSPSIAKWYEENIGKKNTEIILNSPTFTKIDQNNKNTYLNKKFLIPKDSKIFIYIGGFIDGRSLDLILEIFKEKSLNSHVVFLGYGALKEKLIKASKKYPNIHVHKRVEHNKVVEIVKQADVGLCLIENTSLNDYYSLPNKLFECAFAGIPILASNFPDILKVVNQYQLGKCVNLDAESIYQAIKEFESMKKIPKINANSLYDLSWAAQEEKLIKLYKSLV